MYRILGDLVWGNGRELKKGALDKLDYVSEKLKKRLEERGLIVEVAAPPLSILPGFEGVADELKSHGIEDVNDLADADPEVLEEVGLASAEAVSSAIQFIT